MNWRGVVSSISRIRESANLLIEQELSRRGVAGVQPAHGPVLLALFESDRPLSLSTIVDRVGRVKSTVSGMVDTLHRYGFIERKQSPDDRRKMLISLTPAGEALEKDFREISGVLQERLFADMPITERDRLASLLSKLEANLQTK